MNTAGSSAGVFPSRIKVETAGVARRISKAAIRPRPRRGRSACEITALSDSESARLRKRLLELERYLERQIAEEEYEAAAAVRDQIKEIEGKLELEAESGKE